MLLGRPLTAECIVMLGGKLFQFSLREIVLLTALAAVFCGWWADHRRLIIEVDRLTPKRPDLNVFDDPISADVSEHSA